MAYYTATATATHDDLQLKMPGRTATTEEIKYLYNIKPIQMQVILNNVEEVVLVIDYWLSISNHKSGGVKAFWNLSSATRIRG